MCRILILLWICLSHIQCHKDACKNALANNTLHLQFVKNGKLLDPVTLSKIKMYYVKQGVKVEDPNDIDTGPSSPVLDQHTFLIPGEIIDNNFVNQSVLSNGYTDDVAALDIHRWFIEFPEGNTDDLLLIQSSLDCEEGAKNRCNCHHPYTGVFFRGRECPVSTMLRASDGKAVFVVELN